MQVDKIILPSAWGRDIVHKYVQNGNPSVAVFFPGQNYSCELPLLYYTSKSAYEAGHDLLMLEYGYQSARTAFDKTKVDQLIQECYTSISQIIHQYNEVVFVSKSLGTYIAGKTAELFKEKSIRHMFLTPIRSTIPFIEKFGGFVVSGTEDPVFQEEDMKQVEGFRNTEVLRIQDADHLLEVSNVNRSLEILNDLVEKSSRFFSKSCT